MLIKLLLEEFIVQFHENILFIKHKSSYIHINIMSILTDAYDFNTE